MPAFDWTADEWQRIGRDALDLVVEASTNWEQRRPAPAAVDASADWAQRPVPEGPQDPVDVLRQLRRDVLPAAAFNGHPRWMGYITASAVPVSVVGDFIATALNQNVAAWRTAPGAALVEEQTVNWIKELLRYPSEAEGVFVSGGQMANILAHAVLRDAKSPWDVRQYGVRGPQGRGAAQRIYVSDEVHYCHDQAAEFLGMGRDTIRRVPVDDGYRMRLDALETMVAEDRARGDQPIAVVGTAGTVGSGAVDPLPALREFTEREDLWFHVDGAYGAFAMLAESRPADLDGLATADSVACDPHKWLFAPIDAAVVLVREPGRLQQSFAFHPDYLPEAEAGPDLYERTPENTRPFRALKVWLALQAFGRDGYARVIERNIQLSARMEERIRRTATLRVAAPRDLSITCWRVEPEGLDAARLDQLQAEVIAELERRGIAVVSNHTLRDGGTAIRACIVNFRTGEDDVDAIVDASAEIGRELARR